VSLFCVVSGIDCCFVSSKLLPLLVSLSFQRDTAAWIKVREEAEVQALLTKNRDSLVGQEERNGVMKGAGPPSLASRPLPPCLASRCCVGDRVFVLYVSGRRGSDSPPIFIGEQEGRGGRG